MGASSLLLAARPRDVRDPASLAMRDIDLKRGSLSCAVSGDVANVSGAGLLFTPAGVFSAKSGRFDHGNFKKNHCRNSEGLNAVAGDIGAGGVMPDFWTFNVNTSTGLTRTVVGRGSNANGHYTEFKLAGTVGGAGSIDLSWEAKNSMAATPGSVWSINFGVEISDATALPANMSLTTAISNRVYTNCYNASGGFLVATTGGASDAGNFAASYVKFRRQGVTCADLGTAFLGCGLFVATVNGETINCKIRIYDPVVERDTVSAADPTLLRTNGSAKVYADLLGLMIEPALTNLLLWSEDTSQAAWTNGNSTKSLSGALMPGGIQMNALIENTTAGVFHYLQQNVTKAASSLVYSYGFFVVARGREVAVVLSDATGSNGVGMRFNPATGAVSSAAAAFGAGFTAIAGGFRSLGGGLYFVYLTAISNATTTIACQVSLHNGTTNTYTGDGTSGVNHWGHILVQSNAIMGYITSQAAQVARAADVVNWTLYGAPTQMATGALYFEGIYYGNALSGNSFPRLLSLFKNSDPNNYSIDLYAFDRGNGTVTVGPGVRSAGAGPAQASEAITIGTTFRLAMSWDFGTGVVSYCLNGGAVQTMTGAPSPAIDRFGIAAVASFQPIPFVHAKAVRCYRGALTNAQLQQITR